MKRQQAFAPQQLHLVRGFVRIRMQISQSLILSNPLALRGINIIKIRIDMSQSNTNLRTEI